MIRITFIIILSILLTSCQSTETVKKSTKENSKSLKLKITGDAEMKAKK